MKPYNLCLWQLYVFRSFSSWKLVVIHQVIYNGKKILIYFGFREVRILFRKVKLIWSTHFPHVISTNIMKWNAIIVIKYPVKIKQKFSTSSWIYWNLRNRWLLCAQHIISSIIFRTRGPNSQDNDGYVLDFYVPSDVHFSHFEMLKITFFTYLHFALRDMY